MAEKEDFYDSEIAPALMALAKKCEDRGLSFLAVVEWEKGETGRTLSMQPGSGVEFRMAEVGARAQGNVDALIFALMKYGREHGHSSICLAGLGVPAGEPKDIAP